MHVIPQSWSHLHILVGVFPSFGLLIALCFFIAGIRTKNAGTQRTCLVLIALLALLSICPMVRLRRRCSQGSPPFSGSKTSPNTLGTFCHVAGVIELAKSAKGFTPTAGRGTWAIQDDPIAQVGEVLDGHRGQSERDHPASLPRASMFSVLCP